MQKHALLIIRADAGADIGTGHLMRAIALGGAWERAGGTAILITASEEALRRRAEGSFTRVYSLGTTKRGVLEIVETIRLIKNISVIFPAKVTWLALDGYHFNEYYQRALQTLNFPLLVLDDDAHLMSYNCDIVLNQNAGAERFEYSVQNTKLLLGTDYVLLRDEFLVQQPEARTTHSPFHLLITMGGNDKPNVSGRLLKLADCRIPKDVSIRVIVGATNPHYEELRAYCESSQVDAKIVYATDDMPRHMRWADLAISSAGITTWELCYEGVPTALLQISEHQRELAKHIARTGAAENLGWHSDIDDGELERRLRRLIESDKLRGELSAKARQLVDGIGAQRLFNILRDWKQPVQAAPRFES